MTLLGSLFLDCIVNLEYFFSLSCVYFTIS